MDCAQIKDRYLQMAATARGLLTDFRELEQNFRDLDRKVRERIATWDGAKGALLHEVFGDRDAISDSDQGKTFRAFWDLLMSPARQEELTTKLEAVLALPAVIQLAPDPRMARVHYDWLEAGEVAQRTVARLSQQLRRYLDDQAWLENRRVMQLVRGIEQHALGLREIADDVAGAAIDEVGPVLELPLDRPLYAPLHKARLSVNAAVAGGDDVPTNALYDHTVVDKARLLAHVRRALQTRAQVSLQQLVDEHPLEHGLAELVAYLGLAAEDRCSVIDDANRQTIGWTDAEGVEREATP